MSLILTEGFEDGVHVSRWNYGSWTGIDTAYGRNGRGGYFESGANLGYNIPVADQHDTLVWGFVYRSTQAHNSGSGNIFGFFSDAGATQHIRLAWNVNTYDLNLSYGPTNAGVIFTAIPGYWYYIEVKAKLHDTLGTIEVRVNGTTVYSATNVDTKNGGTKTVFDHLRLSTSNISPTRRINHMDDMYLLNGAGSVNNDFLGDIAIETLFPNGNGDVNNFLGSDGNSTDNYLLVDDASEDYTDWAGGMAVGDKDLYNIQNPVRTLGPVYGAVITALVLNGDSGPRSLGLIAKKGTTQTTPTGVALTTTPSFQKLVIESDFDAGGQLTISDVNALQIGAEITA